MAYHKESITYYKAKDLFVRDKGDTVDIDTNDGYEYYEDEHPLVVKKEQVRDLADILLAILEEGA